MEALSSQDPDPNHNSSGVSAADSVWLVDDERELRVPYYCEENVWRLAHRKLLLAPHGSAPGGGSSFSRDAGSNDYWVVFVSNPVKNVPMFHQRASRDAEMACCWDYHVILVGRDSVSGTALVWDMDSRLPYPCPLSDYLAQTFPYEWPDPHGPQFRVLPAATYLRTFASDRSHMFHRTQRRWTAPPPPYDVVQTERDAHTLPLLLDFARHAKSTTDQQRHRLLQEGALGTILSLEKLKEQRF